MDRHAYLIMIHEQNEQLNYLLQALDYEYNDIYIHVDKKCKVFSKEKAQECLQKSKIYFVKSVDVIWSAYSLVQAELNLLQAAVKNIYAYYHLLSGSDLPIKKQQEIHSFFDKNKGKEFVHFGTEEYQEGIKSRYNVFHFFQKQLGRSREGFFNKAETYSLAIQRRLHIERKPKNSVYGGANWFSITHDFATYVLQHIKDYRFTFLFTQNTDELFLQTILMNSPFKDSLYITGMKDDYHQIMRYIDWKRGKNGGPHTFTIEDYEEIKNSDALFARKFSMRADEDIVKRICKEVREN